MVLKKKKPLKKQERQRDGALRSRERGTVSTKEKRVCVCSELVATRRVWKKYMSMHCRE